MKITQYPSNGEFYTIDITKDVIIITSDNDSSFITEVYNREPSEFYHKDFANRIHLKTKVFVGIEGSFLYEALCAFEE